MSLSDKPNSYPTLIGISDNKVVRFILIIVNLALVFWSLLWFVLAGAVLLIVSPAAVLSCDHPLGGDPGIIGCTGLPKILVLLTLVPAELTSLCLIWSRKPNLRIVAIGITMACAVATLCYMVTHDGPL